MSIYVPAIVIAIPQVFLCLAVAVLRRHVVQVHGLPEALFEATVATVVVGSEIVHGVMVFSGDLDLVQRRDIPDHEGRQVPGLVAFHEIGSDLKRRHLTDIIVRELVVGLRKLSSVQLAENLICLLWQHASVKHLFHSNRYPNRPDSRGIGWVPIRATPPPAMSCIMAELLSSANSSAAETLHKLFIKHLVTPLRKCYNRMGCCIYPGNSAKGVDRYAASRYAQASKQASKHNCVFFAFILRCNQKPPG